MANEQSLPADDILSSLYPSTVQGITPEGLASLYKNTETPTENTEVQTTSASLPPYARGLLDTLASTESPGAQPYHTLFGGQTVSDLSKHPGIATPIPNGPNKGKTSSAAGRYMFLEKTWEDQAKKLGLTDFSPENQDLAAWNLAKETYAKTGRSLEKDIKSDNPHMRSLIGQVLSPIWTSLPGGIEQSKDGSKFSDTLASNIKSQLSIASAPLASTTAPAVPEGFKQIQLSNGSYLNYNENYSLEEALQKVSEKNPGVDFSLKPEQVLLT